MTVDPYSFAPGDPPVLMPRRLAVEVLNSLEMWRDMAEVHTGRRDESTVRRIEELIGLLSDPGIGDVVLVLPRIPPLLDGGDARQSE